MEEKDLKQTTQWVQIEEPIEELIPDLENPPQGKAWRRKSDGMLFPRLLFLGELHFLNGERLEEPIKELPKHFELVDMEI